MANNLTKVVRIKSKPKVTKNALISNSLDDTRKGNEILDKCRVYWDGLAAVREQRRINRDFRNGHQWKKSEIYKSKQARPFHEEAQRIVMRENLMSDALRYQLKKDGFDPV